MHAVTNFNIYTLRPNSLVAPTGEHQKRSLGENNLGKIKRKHFFIHFLFRS